MRRVFIEKKSGFDLEAQSFIKTIKANYGITLKQCRLFNVYDVDHLTDEEFDSAVNNVLSEPNIDIVSTQVPLEQGKHFAVTLLPAQFDARAESAMQCVKLLFPQSNPLITTAQLYLFDNSLTDQDLNTIKDFVINKIEMMEKDLATFGKAIGVNNSQIKTIEHFTEWDNASLQTFRKDFNLAMNIEDLLHVQLYFAKTEHRNPTETEIKVLDTYWSDHCRHTTFETEITDVQIEDCDLASEIKKAFQEFETARQKLAPHKPRTLMNLATINFKELQDQGLYSEVEVSSEINACAVFAHVDVNNHDHKYLIQFKNETHNHPTEVEPFGGASTCLGGAIRDPLSGRAYVYQGIRISGSGNPLEPINETIYGKLPQQTIVKGAAHGFSSYGNQIGIPTTLVEEIVHPGYKAKRLEAGAVVGASPAENVTRLNPQVGDIIVLLGGATGRDGIGGATGSSKEHDDSSASTSASEVQKGNAPEERKLQRLFSNPQFSTLVKKSNDFGAGGVAVAIGELADSLEIDLDAIPLKYQGLNGTEIALSESQERMAIVIAPQNLQAILELAQSENLMATEVAVVTDTKRLIMKWQKQTIVDIARDFIETNGVRQQATAVIAKQEKYVRTVEGASIKEQFLNNLQAINVASQQGMAQMFDSTIGNTTVLNPYGGKYQLTKVHASVQKVPMRGGDFTNTVTLLAAAYNPFIASASPFLGGAYAVVASIAKIIAYGGNLESLKFSFQEYFEKLNKDPLKWGKPLASLLGATHALREFSHAAIGGKDSMSGTFNDLHVPPTLISFAFNIAKVDNIISSEFKNVNNYIYVLKHTPQANGFPNFAQLKTNFSDLETLIKQKKVVAAWPLVKGGIAEALAQMAMGNGFGFKVTTNLDLFDFNYGTIVVESPETIHNPHFIKIGQVTNGEYEINGEVIAKADALAAWRKPWSSLFPITINEGKTSFEYQGTDQLVTYDSYAPLHIKKQPLVIIPVFPGTNCEFDIERKFVREGAKVKQIVFNNQTSTLITKSITALASAISEVDILALPGGFSAGDEPDGSGKFIANILRTKEIKQAINELLARKGLIIGICNGFQALIKSGLLPYGDIKVIKAEDPTLFKNDINAHVAKYVQTKVSTTKSPWLQGYSLGQVHSIPISHGEGKFVASEATIKQLQAQGQIAFQYVDENHQPTMNGEFNPNGSIFAIEGIVSPDGLILGKMGHSERYEENIAKNIDGDKDQNIFKNAVRYFRGEFK